MSEDKYFQQRFQKLEELIAGVETYDEKHRAGVKEIIQLLMEIHGAGLDRMLAVVNSSGHAGSEILHHFAKDPAIGSLLLLYGLHPDDLKTRVLRSLEKVRPYLRSHGGNVELVKVEQGNVLLRMEGSCHGCPSSSLTLKLAIEDAIYEAAPDIVSLQVDGVVERKQQAYVVRAPRPQSSADEPSAPLSSWQDVSISLHQGATQSMEVNGKPLLFCKLGESLYAYGNHCPSCGQTLQNAALAANQIECATCGKHYDVTCAGKSLDQPELHLEPVPLLVEQGRVRVALPA